MPLTLFLSLVVVGSTFYTVARVDAVSCHACSTEEDDDIYNSGCYRFVTSLTYDIPCHDADACFTFRGTIDGVNGFVRDCVYRKTTAGCEEVVNDIFKGYSLTGTFCYCTSNMCNGGLATEGDTDANSASSVTRSNTAGLATEGDTDANSTSSTTHSNTADLTTVTLVAVATLYIS